FLAFAIPLAVRAIPEILMGPFVVGFDTLGYYVPFTLASLTGGVSFWAFIAVAPFLYILLIGVTSIGVPIVISLKVMSPLLLGFLGIAVYFYANKTLSWSSKKSLLVVLFATLYFVALRVSWDMLRSELGLVFLFTTLIFLKKDGRLFRSGILLSLAMVSVVFAHQLIAVIMFAIVIATILRSYFDKKMVELRRLIVCSAPAACLFFVIIYAVAVQFSLVSGFPSRDSGGLMALFGFASYADLVVDTSGFLVFCYLPLMPLLVLGARRSKSNLQLKAWIFWIFLSLFLIVISPNAFFAVSPYRWTLLLTYPLAFYAAEAFSGIKRNSYKVSVGLILATLSVGFMVLPNNLAFPYYVSYPNYVPTSMLQNTVSLSDSQDTVNALQWVRNNMPSDARLLVHDVFYGWASLTLDGSQLIPYGYGNPETVAQKLEENGSAYPLYLIWWVNGSGWHGQSSVSSAFRQVYQSGRIAVFTFTSGL
ncbi:hypothetical protein MUO79_07245, partial [Candidatus Bathyarchaeota archaeon]|nr:hypothetical protein [Candidatus Bathyarchaeota archaeon]